MTTLPATSQTHPRHDDRVTPRRLFRRFLAGLALAVAMLFALPAAPASAHAGLVGASPAQNSVVNQAPAQVVLTWSEQVTPVNGKVRVIAPDGSRADTGEPRTSGAQLIIPLKPGRSRGTYLVSFRVISADSHPVGGAFTYSVGVPSPPPSDTEVNVSADPTVTAAFPVVRWIGFAGLLLLVGSVLVLALLWPQRLDRTGPTRVIWLGAGLVGLSTVLELYLQIPYVTGGSVFTFRGSDVQDVLSSQYGAAHLVRLGVLVAALFLLRPIVRGKGWGADRVLLAVLGAIAVGTWSVSGHPSASKVPMVTVASVMVHIASMSIWLGGLGMLIVFLLPRATPSELRAIVPVWSRWAAYAVSALLITGLAQAIILVGTFDALVSNAYGWLLLVKVALVLVVLGIAGLSRRLVPAIVERAKGATVRLRGLVIAEAVAGVVILGLTSVLVQTSPASTASASTTPTVQSATMRDKLFTLSVDIEPAAVGANELHLYANTPDGQPADVKEWTVKASQPSQGIEPIDAAVLVLEPDHAIGQIGLPSAGDWTFTFTVRTTDIDESTVTANFTIAK
jgi:copper transport protein